MTTFALPQTDLVVSRLAYGCMRIAGVWDPNAVTAEHEAAGRAALLAAYDSGYTLFDHADIYSQGACEKIHGNLLAESPSLRGQTILATKCGIRFPGDPNHDSPHRYDFRAEHIVWSCEQSLRRLQVETIDIYQLHRPDYLMNPDEVADAFTRLKESGKVRWFGVSNFLPSKVEALQSRLRFPLTVNQVEIHLGRLACFEDGTLDQCLTRRITPLAWSPLGGGWLGAGREAPTNPPHLAALVDLMDAIAEVYGVTRTEIALRWLLAHPAGVVPIVGSTRPEAIRQAVHALDEPMGYEDWYRLLVAARGEGLP